MVPATIGVMLWRYDYYALSGGAPIASEHRSDLNLDSRTPPGEGRTRSL